MAPRDEDQRGARATSYTGQNMVEEARILALYKTPFRYDGIFYIWDAQNEMVADFGGKNDSFRVRGWGRMSYMDNAEELHDTAEAYLLKLVGNATEPEKIVEILNAHWRKK